MNYLPLLADFNLLRPDIGLIFWAVVLLIVFGLAFTSYTVYRLLRSER